MHNSIQQSILLSLILILAAHMLFSPVALSVIFATHVVAVVSSL